MGGYRGVGIELRGPSLVSNADGTGAATRSIALRQRQESGATVIEWLSDVLHADLASVENLLTAGRSAYNLSTKKRSCRCRGKSRVSGSSHLEAPTRTEFGWVTAKPSPQRPFRCPDGGQRDRGRRAALRAATCVDLVAARGLRAGLPRLGYIPRPRDARHLATTCLTHVRTRRRQGFRPRDLSNKMDV